MTPMDRTRPVTTVLLGSGVVTLTLAIAVPTPSPDDPGRRTLGQESTGCLSCHAGIESMHQVGDDEIGITCVDCHGGNGAARDQRTAHVQPRNRKVFASSANPVDSYAALNQESPEFVRFMNPGDLRVASAACGGCHEQIVNRMLMSIMGTGALVAQAAFYNNGVLAAKRPVYGEGYLPDGTPAIIRSTLPDQTEGLLDLERRGPTSLVPKLEPLPRFQVIPALDPFRVLERGNNAAGTRARGTDFKIAGAGLAVQKTRLNDPTLWFIGTNQTTGDYRHSGCAACHVLYANDRDTLNAGPEIAAFYRRGGLPGHSGSADPSIPKTEPGHPIAHRFTRRVPVSQCLTCHHHQGNAALVSYTGTMWWDQETGADEVLSGYARRDYEMDDAARARLWDRNPEFTDVQFSDLHGHSWNFRNVYKRDRQGRLLDAEDDVIPHDDPSRFARAVHLRDVHLERGMHCVDCHTEQDIHGDGRLWGATPDPIEIACIDCHGTVSARATLVTSGINGGTDLASRLSGPRTVFGTRAFEIDGPRVIQRSRMYENLQWAIPQIVDAVNPNHPRYNERAAKAMTMRADGSWGPVTDGPALAHDLEKIECYTCHTSWNTGCYGCHLPLDLNTRTNAKHYEGQASRGDVAYNPQVLRSDNFLLGINASSKGNKVSPIRSASAVFVTVTARNRQVVVHQQPTVSAPGYSGFAFSPNIPHTVRARETMRCTDCHLSSDQDNNAWLTSVLGMGTNTMNFVGEYAYLALGSGGVIAVKVTEGGEPQPVIGSHLHRILHPESYDAMVAGGRRLSTAYGLGTSHANRITTRGEYVLVADGPGGLRVIDRANVANKNEAQRLVGAQHSALGEGLRVNTRDATAVALPSGVPMNLDRRALPENLEKPVAELFRYAFVTDRHEGLITVDVNTLHDGDPTNNFLRRAATYNPEGRLDGAVNLTIAGNYALIVSERSGLNVVEISNPRAPRWLASVGAPAIRAPRAVAVQFRYAFVADADGVKVVELTDPARPRFIEGATVALTDARDVLPARTYLYAAAGRDGLAIIDIEEPEDPRLVDRFTADGAINDATAVTTGSVNASLFAFLADGVNGLRVIRLIGPPDAPGHQGFSPAPAPQLIATYRTRAPAVAIAHGPSRDRVVDESGNQIGVMGRLGSRPLEAADRARLLLRNGSLFFVDNDGRLRSRN